MLNDILIPTALAVLNPTELVLPDLNIQNLGHPFLDLVKGNDHAALGTLAMLSLQLFLIPLKQILTLRLVIAIELCRVIPLWSHQPAKRRVT